MRKNILKKVSGFVSAALICFSLTLKSQTLNEAKEAFNKGTELYSTNVNEAIQYYEKCIEICNQLGEEGNEIRLKAGPVLPGLYFSSALEFYKAKDYDQAIAKFTKTIEVAEKFNDIKIQERAAENIPKLYYTKANILLKEQKPDEAIANYNKAIELEPTYAKAYLALGSIYKKQGDLENLEKVLNKAIETGTAINDKTGVANDPETAEKAKNALANSLISEGKKAYNEKAYDKAFGYYEKSLQYDEKNPETYYLISIIHNLKSQWDKTIENGNKSLELSTGSPEEKAQIYYELGRAYAAKGEKEAACNAYKNANFGNYAQNVTSLLKELQCN